ncbi:dipeptidyl aminopeptidase/acylaminoacyl peptidase [Saccharomonospora marina XMU15]|uniref:Dipeptidyl aminopeptidase/acylaminoacyl peptidase n=1 Tax=Saccharomonospora marina XMU15 TaxID=882083 RepID=H5WXR6_9PSEU|nr:S9 family peptidase [Saccharomonospora marina]EHR51725.1 dipeptidyl aminopeptidase/acylaminoacyl peptidase [Saccharomonospora marina XMU15]
MRPADLELFAVPGRPALHGELLLTALTRPDLRTDSYVGALRRIDLDGVAGTGTAWTHGERDASPAISPDGRWVAFTRAQGRERPQLYVMPTDGGEPRRLTALPLGVNPPVWAPDSRRIAFTARVPEPGRYGTPADGDAEETGPEPDAEPPRLITRFDYRIDDVGFLRDRPARLFVLDALDAPEAQDGAEQRVPTPLTDDRASVSDPAWTPDGTHVLVVAPRDWDRSETLHSDIYAVPATGGAPALLARTSGRAAKPTVTADGTVLFYADEYEGFSAAARNTGLWAAALTGGASASPRRLTDPETVDCVGEAGPPAPHGDGVLVVVRNRGAAELRSVPRSGQPVALDAMPVLAGRRAAVRTFVVDGERVAVVRCGQRDAGEVVLLEGGEERTLTDFSEPIRQAGIHPATELTATAPDGYPVHGWLVEPEGEGPHPVLLLIHGGPFAQYEWSLFDEAQMYASAGYAVLLGNPRGSAGYGQRHGRAVVGALGTVDAHDLLALLDEALRRPDLDGERVGVQGGSYGGFMTGWLAAWHGDRFRAAWSERAVNAWDSFVGSSDIGWWFAENYVGSDPELLRKTSPLTYADRITIPFAVVHSERDWRCPLEQAQRMFVALRRNGTDTELLLFPGEGHELTRSGKPRHRKRRFEAVLEWWRKHLPPAVT